MNRHGFAIARFCLGVLLALLLCVGAASAEDNAILGKPFPDFTVTDTEGNTFTLSEALKDHEAVLINLWATWCGPCRLEMPFLNEAYEQYGDRVPFIALSTEPEDTLEIIEAYRQELGLNFPMSRDEDAALYQYASGHGIPTTVIVDRFGNAAFAHIGSFFSAGHITRAIEAFLGDGYTETNVLTEIPKDASTRAFPVAPVRAIHVENEGAKCAYIWEKDSTDPITVYVVEDDFAHLRLEMTASDDPVNTMFYSADGITVLQDLFDADRNAFVVDMSMPKPKGEPDDYYTFGILTNGQDEDPGLVSVHFVPSEEYLELYVQEIRDYGVDIAYEYVDPEQGEQDQAQAYLVHVVDQDGEPVPDVAVNFCTDTACTPQKSDESGTITFEGAPDVYHIQVLSAPEGYSFDPDYEMYTEATYGELLLRIRKD